VFGISFYLSYYRLTKKTTDKLTHADEWKLSFWLELLHPFRFITMRMALGLNLINTGIPWLEKTRARARALTLCTKCVSCMSLFELRCYHEL